MKKFLSLIILLMAAITIHSQETEELKPLSFSEVVKVDSMSAQDLHEAMKRWVATVYKNPDKVTKYDNNGDEMIINSMFYKDPGGFTTTSLRGNVSYTIDIQFREGRMKVSMKDFYHTSTNPHIQFNLGVVYNRDLTKQEAKERDLVGGMLKTTTGAYNSAMESYRKVATSKWDAFITTIKLNILQIKSQKAEDDW